MRSIESIKESYEFALLLGGATETQHHGSFARRFEHAVVRRVVPGQQQLAFVSPQVCEQGDEIGAAAVAYENLPFLRGERLQCLYNMLIWRRGVSVAIVVSLCADLRA